MRTLVDRSSRPRVLRALEWGLVTLLAAWFAWSGLRPAWRELNTDFPNYYLAAKLLRGGDPLDRLYDWTWFERQKDHAGIDRGLVGYGLLTPHSAIVLAPFTALSPLAAKRCWTCVNLLLLAATGVLLRASTRLGGRRVALLVLLTSAPLASCFAFGQQHVLVLFLLTLAGWLFVRGRDAHAGMTLAVAAVLKVYPAVFALYFLAKLRWRALAALGLTCALLVALWAVLLGPEALVAYASVLSRSTAGEGTDPYVLSTSTLTVLLRRLFVAEPSLNPRPLVEAPWAYCLLQPALGSALLGAGLWLASSRRRDPEREALEWGAFVALLMLIATASASYHFCALVVATVLGVDFLLRLGRRRAAIALAALHALVCAPFYGLVPADLSGWSILLGVPRYAALAAYCGLFAWVFVRVAPRTPRRPWEAKAYALGAAAMAVSGVRSSLRHFDGQFDDYAARLPVRADAFIATAPAAAPDGVYFARSYAGGYLLDRSDAAPAVRGARGVDLLSPSVAPGAGDGWIEIASLTSRAARFPLRGSTVDAADLTVEVDDAEQPVASADGAWLGFVRESGGRGGLWVRPLGGAAPSEPADRRLVASDREVFEFSFFPDDRIVFAARDHGEARLMTTGVAGEPIRPLPGVGAPARYPAVSPDGRRLAYSRREDGAWHLYVLDWSTGSARRITRGDCDSVLPAWSPDSASVAYASDCGRGVGLTALCRVRVP